jgi:serine/threonine protein kinase
MSDQPENPDESSLFPEVNSTFAAGLSANRLVSGNPGVSLEGEDKFVDAMLGKLSPDTDEIQRKLRYIMGQEIGRGGMGAVFQVVDSDLRRTLAMKVALPYDGEEDEKIEFISRFLEEAQVTGQLDHPGIVPLHEVGMDSKGRIYFTMRMVKGDHLGKIFKQARKRENGWTIEKGVVALMRVCESMAYAHDKGVVHRDLKPANVMAGRFGEVYVMDWGLCKVRGRKERHSESETEYSVSIVHSDRVDDDELKTEFGRTMGTPSYMAPEQGRGDWDNVNHKSDIYSVGAMLYTLITGCAPYVPEGGRVAPHTTLKWLLEGPPRHPRELNTKASASLSAICERAMARDPADRYADMLEFADDLRRYLSRRPVRALKLNAFQRTWRWVRRNPKVSAFFLAALLGGGTAVASLARLPRKLVRAAAVDDAFEKTELMNTVNALYTRNVVNRVNREHVTVSHSYAGTPGAIPIPATMLTELGEAISGDKEGLQVLHYSDFPFRFRGPAQLDNFGTEALATLRVDPTNPFVRFTEVGGRSSLRYAVPRIMAEGCVQCHNSHPESTKTDWKVGDVRGVLEIIRPIDRDEDRMRSGLTGSFLLSGGIFAALILAALGLLLNATHRDTGPRGRGQL